MTLKPTIYDSLRDSGDDEVKSKEEKPRHVPPPSSPKSDSTSNKTKNNNQKQSEMNFLSATGTLTRSKKAALNATPKVIRNELDQAISKVK
jgi:hypothetical protein